jgi:hypothetical protein
LHRPQVMRHLGRDVGRQRCEQAIAKIGHGRSHTEGSASTFPNEVR